MISTLTKMASSWLWFEQALLSQVITILSAIVTTVSSLVINFVLLFNPCTSKFESSRTSYWSRFQTSFSSVTNVLDFLFFRQWSQASHFNDTLMHEHLFTTFDWSNETPSFNHIKPLASALTNFVLFVSWKGFKFYINLIVLPFSCVTIISFVHRIS